MDIKTNDPITKRSDILEAAIGGGIRVLMVNGQGSVSIFLVDLDSSNTAQIPLRAIIGLPLAFNGVVQVILQE